MAASVLKRASAITAAALTVGGLSACGGDRPAGARRNATRSTATAAATSAGTSRATMIGQKIMVGFRNRATPPATLLSAIRRGRVGGVILFSENDGAGRGYASVVATLQHAAQEGHRPPLLIAVDQEGGDVRRIAGAPPATSPREMGRAGPAQSRREGRDTGAGLRRRGITVNLAPVADVPDSPSSFLGRRTFGTDPADVGENAAQFASGLQDSGVAATAKHYPGLGTTGARNTDDSVVTVTTDAGELSRRAAPFGDLADAGVRLVMVSNAIYTALDPGTPAVLSARIVSRRLRSVFPEGVVITDALEVPALAPYGARVPVLAARAGVDVLLYTDTNARGAFGILSRAYGRNALSRTQLAASYARIMALKTWIAGRAPAR